MGKPNLAASTVQELIQRLLSFLNKGVGTDNLTNSSVTTQILSDDSVNENKVTDSLLNAIYDRQYPVGWVQPWPWLTLPTVGTWLWLDGRTVGDSSSNATSRANADTYNLFLKIWTDYTDTTAPIFTSAGGASTRGVSALADFNAHKQITLVPDTRGRLFVGMDNYNSGGSGANVITNAWADTLGGIGGVATQTLTVSQMPSHRHKLQSTDSRQGDCAGMGDTTYGRNGIGTPASNPAAGSFAYYDADQSGHQLVEDVGGGTAHNNLQPTIAVRFIIRY